MNVSDTWHVLATVKAKVSTNGASTMRLSGSFNTPMENRRENERETGRERDRERERERERTRDQERPRVTEARFERVNRSICLGFAATTPKQVDSTGNYLEGSGRGITPKTGACILRPVQLIGPYSCHERRFSGNK